MANQPLARREARKAKAKRQTQAEKNWEAFLAQWNRDHK